MMMSSLLLVQLLSLSLVLFHGAHGGSNEAHRFVVVRHETTDPSNNNNVSLHKNTVKKPSLPPLEFHRRFMEEAHLVEEEVDEGEYMDEEDFEEDEEIDEDNISALDLDSDSDDDFEYYFEDSSDDDDDEDEQSQWEHFNHPHQEEIFGDEFEEFGDEFEEFDEDEFDTFEWFEDDFFCYPEDRSWYKEQDFYISNAVCHVDEGEYDFWDIDEMMEEDPFFFYEDDPLFYMSPQEIDQHFDSQDEQPHFLLPKSIEPGEAVPIRWRHTLEIVEDDEIFAVGLPPELLQGFRDYFETTGVLDVVNELLYPTINDTAPYQERVPFNLTRKQEEEAKVWTMKDGYHWNVKRADHWPTDMVWFDPADEACYERLNEILRRGNFEMVMNTIRQQLNQPNLVIHGNGAIIVSHFDDADPENEDTIAHLHRDAPETRGAFYNILIPIYLPEAEDQEASLYIGGFEDMCAPINLKYNVATVIGSDSWHATGECDYRASKGFRLSMSVWVSEITERNVEVLADDTTSSWPIHDDKDWYRAQKGRNLANDFGRAPIETRDLRNDCAETRHRCNFWEVRSQCAKTCGLYMETDEYYSHLDALRSV
ncbi:expressed unknown protein [Seminavis robusta]|uniref:Uncharacterized protein n=1 Tax=Seminavis robusta TaxID=568900 RepID=A0A9N8DAS4_9STRA|nr:expressed unknown protein [Seminavis robusta]|eukprot:Sro64_g036160.1 n/a (594) ;mRNA; r:27523-29397